MGDTLKKTFYADDKFDVVINNLIQRGWIRSYDPSACAFLWTNLKSTNFETNQARFINHYKGAQHFSNKAYLLYHLHLFGHADILPETWSPAYQTIEDLVYLLLHHSILTKGYLSTIEAYPRLIQYLKSSYLPTTLNSRQNRLFKLLTIKPDHPPYAVGSKESQEIWIIKPIGLSCGENISMQVGLAATCREVHRLYYSSSTTAMADNGKDANERDDGRDGSGSSSSGGKCIVQKYLENPLLVRASSRQIAVKPAGLAAAAATSAASKLQDQPVDQPDHQLDHQPDHKSDQHGGYKFDIRQWLVILSLQPLVLYAYTPAYLRLASRPYDLTQLTQLKESDTADPFMHLTNHAIQRHYTRQQADKEEQQEKDGYGFCPTMMTQAEFAAELRSDQGQHEQQPAVGDDGDIYNQQIIPQIQKIALQVIQAVRPHLTAPPSPPSAHTPIAAFEWLGLDLMISKQHQVHLLEVNTSPDISCSTMVTTPLVIDAVDGLLSLLLLDEEDKEQDVDKARKREARMSEDQLAYRDGLSSSSNSGSGKGGGWQCWYHEEVDGDLASYLKALDTAGISSSNSSSSASAASSSFRRFKKDCSLTNADRELLESVLVQLQPTTGRAGEATENAEEEEEDEI